MEKYYMEKKNLLFKSKEKMTRKEAASFLHQFADKLEAGSVQFIQGAQDVTLDLPGQVLFEVEAQNKEKRVKGLQNKIEIEIKWYESDHGQESGKLELG